MSVDLSELLDPDEDASGQASNAQVIAYLWRQWIRRPWLISAMAAFAAASTLLSLSLPIAAGALVEALSGPRENAESAARAAFLAFVLLAGGSYACMNLMSRAEILMAVRTMADLTAESFAKVQRFSSEWHANTFAGATVRKITRGMWAFDVATGTLFYGLGPTCLILIGLPIYMLTQWPIVGAYAALVVACFMTLTLLGTVKYIKPANVRSNARDSAIGAAVADSIGANPVVKSFGAEDRENRRFTAVVNEWRRMTFRTWNRYANMSLLTSAALIALQTGVIGLLLGEWAAGRAGAGDITFAVSAFLLMAGYMRRFGDEVQNVQRALDELGDLALFDAAEPSVLDRPDARVLTQLKGAIRFERVTFAYANQDQPIYDDFDVAIRPGERIALVGPTGSGKSTFVKLVQRLYDVDGGRVTLDGVDVRDVAQASLRQAIALVPQDPALFHRSIAVNIAYGRPNASREDIETAAHRARADEFIARLPKGYDTLVGERGVKLSGGERQRVAIARALLADAPILILDEATSSLDNETEKLVQEAMEELMRGRTTIVIAHRLSTIRAADRILVFENGRIVEQGRHEELLDAPGGVYAKLHRLGEAA